MHQRRGFPVTADDHVMVVGASENAGARWQPAFRISYRRLD